MATELDVSAEEHCPGDLETEKKKICIFKDNAFIILLDLLCSWVQLALWSRDCALSYHISDCGVDGPHSSQEPSPQSPEQDHPWANQVQQK